MGPTAIANPTPTHTARPVLRERSWSRPARRQRTRSPRQGRHVAAAPFVADSSSGGRGARIESDDGSMDHGATRLKAGPMGLGSAEGWMLPCEHCAPSVSARSRPPAPQSEQRRRASAVVPALATSRGRGIHVRRKGRRRRSRAERADWDQRGRSAPEGAAPTTSTPNKKVATTTVW